MDKSLKGKAIDIKGSEYVLVKDRIIYFNENYLNGSIATNLVSDVDSDNVVIQAVIIPDVDKPARIFVDYSQAVKGAGFINKTAALENASTSAVGRALAMMGIGVIDSVASADEINKATGTDSQIVAKKQELYKAFITDGTTDFEDQKLFINSVLGKETVDSPQEADKVLEQLAKQPA